MGWGDTVYHLRQLILGTLRNLTGDITGWQMLRVILGLTLLVAALMKVHELSTTPYLDKFPPRWMMVAFVEFEILFALWLFFVPKKLLQITWIATLGLFSFFACVTHSLPLYAGVPKVNEPATQSKSVELVLPEKQKAEESPKESCCATKIEKEIKDKQKPEGNPPILQDNRVSGPYCGINSLYVCLDSLGIATDMRDYITTDYVGSFQGSSAKELIRAAEHFGANGRCFVNLTIAELRRIDSPAILHFRSTWSDGGFNHWVAFMGIEGDRARIVDPPHPLQTISTAELLANWNGVAVVLDREEPSGSFVTAARIDYLTSVLILIAAVYVVQLFLKLKQKPDLASASLFDRLKRSGVQACVIVGLSGVLAICYHALSEIGFLRNPTALAEVTRRYYSTDIPELTLEQTETELAEGDPLVLDARRVIDYQRGSLPGAKSMSIHSTLPDRQKVLTGVSKSKRIIIYCQSAGCRYADEVAKFLKFNGYENLAIYRDGWREWKKRIEN